MLINILLRSFTSILFLQMLAKITGPKQISQLSFYDYVVGITIGSIAAVFAVDIDIPWVYCVLSMSIFTLVSLLFSILTSKSIFFRKHLTGIPLILIFHGKIIEKNMKKAHFDVNDLLTQCRCQGYFDLNEITFAILETNGQISFLLHNLYMPLTKKDMHKKGEDSELFANVIIDGNIMKEALKSIGKDSYWLLNTLKKKHINNCKDILLACADRNGNLYFSKKNEAIHKEDYFI